MSYSCTLLLYSQRSNHIGIFLMDTSRVFASAGAISSKYSNGVQDIVHHYYQPDIWINMASYVVAEYNSFPLRIDVSGADISDPKLCHHVGTAEHLLKVIRPSCGDRCKVIDMLECILTNQLTNIYSNGATFSEHLFPVRRVARVFDSLFDSTQKFMDNYLVRSPGTCQRDSVQHPLTWDCSCNFKNTRLLALTPHNSTDIKSIDISGFSLQPTYPFVRSQPSIHTKTIIVAHADSDRGGFSRQFSQHLNQQVIKLSTSQPNVRFYWGLVFVGVNLRICLFEHDAMHVSEPLDMRTHSGQISLSRFYASACISSDERVGIDPTMTWIEELGRWKIDCVNDAARIVTVYAEPKPVCPYSPFFLGHTKCLPVSFSPDTECRWILKDTWTLMPQTHEFSDERFEDEIDILKRIKSSIPDEARDKVQKLVCGGSVMISDSCTGLHPKVDSSELVLGSKMNSYIRWSIPHGIDPDEYTAHIRSTKHPSITYHRVHRRMVSGPIGVHLDISNSELEIITVLADIMNAHSAVYNCAGVLHRDISEGNILVVRQGSHLRGMLNDFDNAVDKNSLRNTQSPGTVGTLQFMSIANMERVKAPRTRADDWESLFYILVIALMRDQITKNKLSESFLAVSNGLAVGKRKVTQCTAAFEKEAIAYANTKAPNLIRLLTRLYSAIFMHCRECSEPTSHWRCEEAIDTNCRHIINDVACHSKAMEDLCDGFLKMDISHDNTQEYLYGLSRNNSCLTQQLGQRKNEYSILSHDDRRSLKRSYSDINTSRTLDENKRLFEPDSSYKKIKTTEYPKPNLCGRSGSRHIRKRRLRITRKMHNR